MEPEAPWEPAPLAAAGAAIADEADQAAQDQTAAEGGEPQLEQPTEVPWRGVVELSVRVVFGRLEAVDREVWTLAADERSALVDAWARYLETVAVAPGPLAGALMVTAAVVGPRVALMRRRRMERDAETADPA